MNRQKIQAAALAAVSGLATFAAGSGTASAAGAAQDVVAGTPAAEHARIVDYWTPARRAAAIPRDLVLDPRGQAYLRRPDGGLEPYGGSRLDSSASAGAAGSSGAAPQAGGSGDATPPTITGMDPGANAKIGAAYTFKAIITDPSGVRSASFKLQKGSGAAQSFAASSADGTTWTVSLSGFTDGGWSWYVVAKDKANNTATSATVAFTVDTSGGGGGGGGGDTVTNAPWTGGGNIQQAEGRIYFEMPSNARRTRWAGYVCSGTAVDDGGTTGRSLILTAAHCVYDDTNKAFARNVLFIPNQDGTTGAGTDTNCANDPVGCWTTNFGVVDVRWTTRTFPDNVDVDYAWYVVNDTGRYTPGLTTVNSALDVAVPELTISFSAPRVDDGTPGATSPDFTHALGYSYSDDPNFMYCAEDMTTEGLYNWWLPSCALSGGSSGGAWMQPVSGGNGPVIAVNSWGYTTSPGMAGPKFNGTSASCVFGAAKTGTVAANVAAGDAGIKVTCP